MAKKVKSKDLEIRISDMLEEYGDEIKENLDEITQKLGKLGVKEIKDRAKSTFNNPEEYAAGWKATNEKTRYGSETIIHNATKPWLPHLLEFGHAKVNGGRVAGRPHIKPVEEMLIKKFEEEVKSKL